MAKHFIMQRLFLLLVVFTSQILAAQNVGIGTIAPVARLHVTDSSVLFSALSDIPGTAGNTPISGIGRRMMWYPDKAAFRAGFTGNQWDKDSIGNYSFAAGYATKAKGIASVAIGRFASANGFVSTAIGANTNASGDYSSAMGYSTIASGIFSTAMGSSTNASGDNSSAMGYSTTASGSFSTAMGYGTKAKAVASFTTGILNDVSDNPNQNFFDPTDRIFQIGNGAFPSTFSNAVTVLRNGNTGIGVTAPLARLHVADSSVLFSATGMESATPASPPLSGGGRRMMWYADKAAFRTGYVSSVNWDKDSVGSYSVALGFNNKAKGYASFAAGYNSLATGLNSIAMGSVANAVGLYSTAIGYGTISFGDYAVSTGVNTRANGLASTAMGSGTIANGESATALGGATTANGNYSIAAGINSNATGNYSIAMGSGANAGGPYSTAIGNNTTANGNYSTAMGLQTTAGGNSSTAIGTLTVASGNNSTAVGNATTASGLYSTAMGYTTTANGNTSTAMGFGSNATGDHSTAMGSTTTASGLVSTAMGNGSKATGDYSTAMGHFTTASGIYSVAKGYYTTASGGFSNSLGFLTQAKGDASTAIGSNTIAKGYGSTVVGLYNDSILTTNETNPSPNTPLFMVGNGDNNATRSNAITVLKNGNTGIGTSAPGTRLHIAAGNSGYASGYFPGAVLEGNTNTYLNFLAPAGNETGLLFGRPTDAAHGGIVYNNAAHLNGMEFRTNGNVTRMVLVDNGNFGIGVTDPFFRLDVGDRMRIRSTPGNSAGLWLNNDINTTSPAFIGMRLNDEVGFYGQTGAAGWRFYINTTTGNGWMQGTLTQSSDSRLKKDITLLQHSLEKITQLNGYHYYWKNDQADDRLQTGVLAQEVQRLFPELVSTNKEGILAVNYSGLIPVMIESIKEQQKQIDALTKLVEKLLK